jgi:hypothetical protein
MKTPLFVTGLACCSLSQSPCSSRRSGGVTGDGRTFGSMQPQTSGRERHPQYHLDWTKVFVTRTSRQRQNCCYNGTIALVTKTLVQSKCYCGISRMSFSARSLWLLPNVRIRCAVCEYAKASLIGSQHKARRPLRIRKEREH